MIRNATKNDTGHVNVVTDGLPRAGALHAGLGGVEGLRRDYRRDTEDSRSRGQDRQGSGAGEVRRHPLVGFGDEGREGHRRRSARPSAASSCSTRPFFPVAPTCDQAGTAIVGKKLAEDLGLKVGDTLKVVTEKADYGLGFKKFRISGLFKTGLDVFDDSTFQIGLDDARDLLGLGRGASQVLVMLKDYRDSDAAAKMIAGSLAAGGFESFR